VSCYPPTPPGRPSKALVRVALLAVAAAAPAPALDIKSATLDGHAGSVKILYDNGRTQTVRTDPDTETAAPVVSKDRRSVAWSILRYVDASYRIPADVEAYRDGKPVPNLQCGGGVTLGFQFIDRGRQIALDCSFPHGVPDEHRVLIDMDTGKTLASLDVDNETGKLSPNAPAWARFPGDK